MFEGGILAILTAIWFIFLYYDYKDIDNKDE